MVDNDVKMIRATYQNEKPDCGITRNIRMEITTHIFALSMPWLRELGLRYEL
jgi:hypothetical protein